MEAFFTSLSATSSCPCPRDTLCKVPWSIVKPSFSPGRGEYQEDEHQIRLGRKKEKENGKPSFSTSLSGSTPGDRMKNTGLDGLLSSYNLSNSSLVASTYFDPMLSSAKALVKTFAKSLLRRSTSDNSNLGSIVSLPQRVGHPVRTQSSKDDELLERTFILPVMRESLLLRTSRLNDLPPAFGRALHVPVQPAEVLQRRDHLRSK